MKIPHFLATLIIVVGGIILFLSLEQLFDSIKEQDFLEVEPSSDYVIDIIDKDGLTIISEFTHVGRLVVRDTISIDSVSTWILNDNL